MVKRPIKNMLVSYRAASPRLHPELWLVTQPKRSTQSLQSKGEVAIQRHYYQR